MTNVNIVFVFENIITGEVKAVYLTESNDLEKDEDWNYIKSLDPRDYIEKTLRENIALVWKMKNEI